MKENIIKITEEAKYRINEAIKEQDLLNLKSMYIGKEGILTEFMKKLKDLNLEEKKEIGYLINNAKKEIETLIKEKIKEMFYINNKNIEFDNTLPIDESMGSLSPISIVAKEITDILKKMGFIIVSGPEKEYDYYNFEALNIPKNHPARDMQDTYWLSNNQLLRTHTSPCQVRAMEKYGAPLRIAAPGRCFRNEDIDASHENTFFQLEGMVVDENISINNLLYVMKNLLSNVFEKEVEVRLRPGFFPFVEPGFELDVQCFICRW